MSSTAEKTNIPWREMTREILESEVYNEMDNIQDSSIVYPDCKFLKNSISGFLLIACVPILLKFTSSWNSSSASLVAFLGKFFSGYVSFLYLN